MGRYRLILIFLCIGWIVQPARAQVNVLAMGDWGTNGPRQREMAQVLADYAARQDRPIDAMLLASGHEVIAKPGGPAPDLVIADVNRTDPAEVIARFPGVPVLGFGQHTDPQALRAARRAGFAKVVARSVLSERLPELVAELVR